MKTEKIFLLRGLIRESRHWGEFLSRLEQAFPEKEIIALDLPGTGSLSAEVSPRNVAGIMERVRAEFVPQKGQCNTLFAVSLGGMVATEWLRKYPEDFSSAVLVNTSMKGLSPFYHRLLPSTYFTVLKLFLSGSILGREREILKMVSNRPEMREATAKVWAQIAAERPISKATALNQLLAAARFSPPASAPIGAVLVLNSAHDRLCSPACSERLAKAWDMPLKTHASAGHDLTLDDPDWAVNALKEFMLGEKRARQ